MKYLFLLLPIFFLQSALTAQTPKPDFQIDQFHPKWGAKNIESPTDIQASAKVYSDGEKIHIEVEVVDDMLVNNADVLHTDHVEVWFGLPIYDSQDFIWNGITQKEQFKNALLPAKHYCFTSNKEKHWLDLPIPKIMIYEKVREYEDLWCPDMEKVKNLACSSCKKIYTMNDFSGIVHFGLFLNNQPAYLYDRENYFLFEQATNYKVGNLQKNVQYQTQFTPKGYRISASFDREALGFTILPEMDEIRLMIDVIDVDISGKQETLLSTSPIRKWGNVFTFNKIKFQNFLNTNFTNVPKTFLETEKQHYPRFMVYSNSGWKNYDFFLGTGTCYNSNYSRGCYNWHTTYNYLPTFLYAEQKTLGGNNLYLIHFNDYDWSRYPLNIHLDTDVDGSNYLVHYTGREAVFSMKRHIGKNAQIWKEESEGKILEVWKTKNLQKEFLFPDGKLGVISYNLIGGNSSGACGGCLFYGLSVSRFTNGKFKKTIKIEDNTLTHSHNVSIHNNTLNTSYGYDVSIEEIKWKEVGKILEIKTNSFENSCQYIDAIYITFNDNGTLQEIYPLPEEKE